MPPGPLALREVTVLLAALRSGDEAALERLFELVYAELRRLARAQLARLPGGATLGTTALVHEAYLKFARAGELDAENRGHFYSLAARAMRQILVDHARRRAAARRGGPSRPLPLQDWDRPVELDLERVLTIDAALEKLEALEPRLARLVEGRVFAGLTLEELAAAGDTSLSTLKREWRRARAFLHRELGPSEP